MLPGGGGARAVPHRAAHLRGGLGGLQGMGVPGDVTRSIPARSGGHSEPGMLCPGGTSPLRPGPRTVPAPSGPVAARARLLRPRRSRQSRGNLSTIRNHAGNYIPGIRSDRCKDKGAASTFPLGIICLRRPIPLPSPFLTVFPRCASRALCHLGSPQTAVRSGCASLLSEEPPAPSSPLCPHPSDPTFLSDSKNMQDSHSPLRSGTKFNFSVGTRRITPRQDSS